MPRSVYFQSAGNPIQRDKLPSMATELEFDYRPADEDIDSHPCRDAIGRALGSSLVGCGLAWLLIACQAAGWLLPVGGVALAIVLLRLAVSTENEPSTWQLTLLSILVACLLVELSPSVTLIALLAGVVYLGREAARHYVFLSTVSPMPREVAWEARESVAWQTLLTSAALLPVSLGFVDTALLPLGFLTSLTACVAIFLLHDGAASRSLRNYRAAAESWCRYNRRDVPVPGILPSPCGGVHRRVFTLQAVLVTTTSTVSLVLLMTLGDWRDAAARPEHLGMLLALLLAAVLATVVAGLFAVAAVALATLLIGLPAYSKYALPSERTIQPDEWKQITDTLRESHNAVERDSLFLGRVASDNSPMLVPREIIDHHAHLSGDSGPGKTSRGLAPLIEQLVGRGDCSCMVLDLKGDSQELLQAAIAAGQTAGERGVGVPIKAWNLDADLATHAFNPFKLSSWGRLTLTGKTDALCGALGLNYGSEYGEGYYSSANAAVVHATLKRFPEVDSFQTLVEEIGYVISRPKAHGLDEKARDAGNHVKMVATRLAAVASLNVTPESTPSATVVENAIDPASLFQHPEVHYYSLPSAQNPSTAPEIGRLAVFMLLAAAAVTKRSTRVYLVIDEFQRLATRNLDYLLQLARSMGVSVILANQSIEDLRRYDLVSVIETNCRYRQWFSVSGWEDQQRLCKNSGETIDHLLGQSVGTSTNDRRTTNSVSESRRQFIAPRLTLNDIKLVSDDDRMSVVLINRGNGYAQYGGMPVVVRSDFHITAEEYRRRRDATWPSDLPGSFVPNQWKPADAVGKGPVGKPARPSISYEEFSTDNAEIPPSGPRQKPRKRRRPPNGQRRPKDSTPPPKLPGPFEEYLRKNPLKPPKMDDVQGKEQQL